MTIHIDYPWNVQKHPGKPGHDHDHDQTSHGRGSRAKGRIKRVRETQPAVAQTIEAATNPIMPSHVGILSSGADEAIRAAMAGVPALKIAPGQLPSKHDIFTAGGRVMTYVDHEGRHGTGAVVHSEDGRFFANSAGTVQEVYPTTTPVELSAEQGRFYQARTSDEFPFVKVAKQ